MVRTLLKLAIALLVVALIWSLLTEGDEDIEPA